jgi:hypothetical protein
MLSGALLTGLALLLAFALTGPASAISYQYRDIDWVGETVTPGSSVSGTLDIANTEGDCILWACDSDNFNPVTHDVFAARVSFVIVGADSVESEVSIELSGAAGTLPQDFDTYQVWALEVHTAQAGFEVLAHLSDYGWLDWEISALAEDPLTASAFSVFGGHRHRRGCGHDNGGFFVKVAQLEAAEAFIPEPAAAMLFALGSGVVGARVRRRRTA